MLLIFVALLRTVDFLEFAKLRFIKDMTGSVKKKKIKIKDLL
jgi:hypothetical protein